MFKCPVLNGLGYRYHSQRRFYDVLGPEIEQMMMELVSKMSKLNI